MAAVAQATAQATAQQVQHTKERQRQAEASCMSVAYHILATARTDGAHHAGQLALKDSCGGTAISTSPPPATSCFAMVYQYVSSMLEAAWRRGDARSKVAAPISPTSSSYSIVLARPNGPASPGFNLTQQYISGGLVRFWHRWRQAPSQQDPTSVRSVPKPVSCFAFVYLYMAWGRPESASRSSGASTTAAVAAVVAASASAVPIAARPRRKISFAIVLEDQFPTYPRGCRIPTEIFPRLLIALPDRPQGGSRLRWPSLAGLMSSNSRRCLLLTPSQETQICVTPQCNHRSATISRAAQRSHSDCARVLLGSGQRVNGLARGGWRSRIVPVTAVPFLMMVPAFLACDLTASAMKLVAMMHLSAMMCVSLSCMAAFEGDV